MLSCSLQGTAGTASLPVMFLVALNGFAYTILLAEDDQYIRDLLCRVLQQSGFTVLSAKDGKHALDIASSHAGPIDLLIADIHMPRMNGVDLARELQRTRPDLPIVLVSGYPDGIALLEVGWHFLSKPFRPRAIVVKLKKSSTTYRPLDTLQPARSVAWKRITGHKSATTARRGFTHGRYTPSTRASPAPCAAP